MDVSDKELRRLINVIVDAVAPRKIVLFGSRAKGVAREDSDYDFLVIKDDITNERIISREIYKRILKEEFSIPVDILAIDTARYERARHDQGLIYNSIETAGVVVYG